MAELRIGLLGASRIAPVAIIEPARALADVTVVAIAARNADVARRYAQANDIPHAVHGYENLINSKAVDLIYNALPPSEHARWTVQALRAGKHVLCEKPLAMNAPEAGIMVQAARSYDRCLVEAFHYRYHPLFDLILKIVNSGSLGKIMMVEAKLHHPILRHKGEIRRRASLGGGALMDLGCYAIHWCRTLFGTEPSVIGARARKAAEDLDESLTAELSFDGIPAFISCSMDPDCAPERTLTISGSRGTLHIDNPLNPHIGHKWTLTLGDQTRSGMVDGPSTYAHQLTAVRNRLLRNGPTLPTEGDDGPSNMRVIDQIYRQANVRRRQTIAAGF